MLIFQRDDSFSCFSSALVCCVSYKPLSILLYASHVSIIPYLWNSKERKNIHKLPSFFQCLPFFVLVEGNDSPNTTKLCCNKQLKPGNFDQNSCSELQETIIALNRDRSMLEKRNEELLSIIKGIEEDKKRQNGKKLQFFLFPVLAKKKLWYSDLTLIFSLLGFIS